MYSSTLSGPRRTEHPMGARRSPLTALAVATVVGLCMGGLTQLAQSFLPEPLQSLANSAAPWLLVAFTVALLGSAPRVAGACGVLSLATSEIGYVATAGLRGFGSAPTTVAFWLAAALCFGPVVGVAAYFVRAREMPWGGLGGGLVAGVVGGEGLAAYLTVRDTTSGGYWIGQMVVALVLLTIVGRRPGGGWAIAAFPVGVGLLLATRSTALVVF